jgi:hypothetical protein
MIFGFVTESEQLVTAVARTQSGSFLMRRMQPRFDS